MRDKTSLARYRKQVDAFYALMKNNEALYPVKISDDKWSLKEMTAHLIDSASNNHQRFIRLQIENDLTFPAYEAEPWVKASNISTVDSRLMIELWKLYNDYLLEIIAHCNSNALENVWVVDGKRLSLSFLIEDYYRHLSWHESLFSTRIKEIGESACQ